MTSYPLSEGVVSGQLDHPGVHNEERDAINDLHTRLGVVEGAAPVTQESVPGANHYIYPVSSGAALTSATLGVGTFRMARGFVPSTVTIARIGAEITSAGEAGSKLRLGIVAEDADTLILDAGTINGDSATVQEITLGTPLVLTRGYYFWGAAVQVVASSQPTVRTVGSLVDTGHWMSVGTTIPSAGGAIQGYSKTGVTGALPSSFGGFASVTASGITPARLFVRLG